MTAARKEGAVYTLAVSTAISLCCAVVVTAAVSYLRPIQAVNEAFEFNRDLAVAAGLLTEPDPSAQTVGVALRGLNPRVLNLETLALELDARPDSIEPFPGTVAEHRSTTLAPEEDLAGIVRRPNRMLVYVVGDPAAPTKLLLPVYGQGMWSTILGIVAVDPRAGTVAALVIHDHGETPAIGDRIEDAGWRAQFEDLDLGAFVAAGPPAAAGDQSPSEVPAFDSITGATISADAVHNMLRFWLGPRGYGPWLETLTPGTKP